MKQEIREQLSALMDGELAHDETRFLLKRVGHDVSLVSCWSRYHTVRQVLRFQQTSLVDSIFADRITRALVDEMPMRARSTWLRWASGGAIAASVAVVALMVSRPTADLPVDHDVTSALPASGASVNAAPASATATAVADFQTPLLVPGVPSSLTSAQGNGDPAEPVSFDPHLQSYLVRHYQATGAAGQQPGFLPYVLLVAPPAQSATTARPEYPAQKH
ncbi:MAG: sigma-E factor negative regulatory protein [Rhodanobacteraceae bacterium]